MAEPSTLQMAKARAPRFFASFTAASVSAVSPDWEMASTSVLWPTTGSRWRNSLASSTSTGSRASCSIMSRPESPACQLVPQATTTSRSTSFTQAGSRSMPSRTTSPSSSETLPRMVSVTARGCSKISLCMKCLCPSFSAATALHSILRGFRVTARPSASSMAMPSGVSIASSPSSR
jgi:hypothetical protein